jgi:polyisoprenoid-binding protein YceI
MGVQRSREVSTVNAPTGPKFCFALLVFILGLAGHEFAKSSPPVSQATLELDRPACKIDFTLGAVLHTVHGTFEVKEGMLRLDVASGKITGRIVVDVKSGNTGNDERDRSMHRDVLESARFPEAVFSPDRLTGQLALAGQSEVGVHGVLRIHGQDHDVTLPAKISVENGRLTATSHLSIPYVKWGMKDPSTFLLHVNDTVEVEMRVAGTIRQQSGVNPTLVSPAAK